MRPIAIAIVASLLAPSAQAGTLDVLVRERNGPPLVEERVEIFEASLVDAVVAGEMHHSHPTRTSDRQGHAVFLGVEPGTYAIDVPRPSNPALIRPLLNGLAPRVLVVVGDASEPVRATLDVWRGQLVHLEVRADPDPVGVSSTVRLEHAELGTVRREVLYRRAAAADLALVPGRTTISLDPPPGYVITSLLRDDFAPPHCVVDVRAEEGGPRVDVTWTAVAVAHASGSVHGGKGGCGAKGVRAMLVTPSAAVEASLAAGCRMSRVVEMPLDVFCHWDGRLTDGAWRFEPIVAEGTSWEPVQEPVMLVAGSSVTIDFTTAPPERTNGDRGMTASVRVLDPDGGPAAALVIAGPPGSEPWQPRGRETARDGIAWFAGLPPGPTLFVASSAKWPPAEVASELAAKATPGSADEALPTIRFERGMSFVATATDENGPVAGVTVVAEAQGDPPPIVVRADAVEAWRRRSALTDDHGRCELTPLVPGSHRVKARLLDERATQEVVTIGRGAADAFAQEIVVETSPEDLGRTIELLVKVAKAGNLAGQVRCDQGGTLPPLADIRALLATSVVEPRTDDEALAQAAWHEENVTLTGHDRDAFRVGPLEPGAWMIAVRPDGFDRWTWAPGKTSRADAMATVVEAGEPTPLPLIAVDCAPIVRLVPHVAEGSPVPDLRICKVRGTRAAAAAKGQAEGTPGPLLPLPAREHVDLRGAPEGAVHVRVEVSHPHFVPGDPVVVDAELQMSNGRLTRVDLPIAGVGGAIEVLASAGEVVARSLDATPPIEMRAEVAEGIALIAHLPAGRYDVSLVGADGATRSWTGVEVAAAQTVRIGP